MRFEGVLRPSGDLRFRGVEIVSSTEIKDKLDGRGTDSTLTASFLGTNDVDGVDLFSNS